MSRSGSARPRVPRPLLGKRRVPPAPPGSVEFTDPAARARFWNADEDVLLRPLEHPDADPHGDPTRAGRWLWAACAMGRADPARRGKQDRVASGLLGCQLSDGWFGTGPGVRPRRAPDWGAQAWCLRGLLAFYAVTHSAAAIDGASACGQAVVRAPASAPAPPELTLPLALLYRQTGSEELLQWCQRRALTGETDAAGLCALYEATGRRAYLAQAVHLYLTPRRSNTVQRDAAAALWTDTGDVRFLPALRGERRAGPVSAHAGVALLRARSTRGGRARVDKQHGGVRRRAPVTDWDGQQNGITARDPHGSRRPPDGVSVARAAVFAVRALERQADCVHGHAAAPLE